MDREVLLNILRAHQLSEKLIADRYLSQLCSCGRSFFEKEEAIAHLASEINAVIYEPQGEI